MTDFRALCAELVAIEDALTGRALVSANQGQALDGFSALAHFRDIADRARAALARPKLQGPTDEELHQLWQELYIFHDGPTSGEVAEIARAVLARWGRPAIKPVPIAERLPGPEDCDAEGCCWVASEDCPAWHRVSRHFDAWHYWLPHHALPVPQQEADRG